MAIADGQYLGAAYAGAVASTSTPTITATSGTITTASGSCRWFRIGNLVYATYNITITTAGTGAAELRCTLPVNATFGTSEHGSGREVAATGAQLVCWIASATQVSVKRYDNATVIASGANARFSIMYEAV